MNAHELYRKWLAAEAAWVSQLGNRSRYSKEAEGKPGTPLNAAFVAWRQAGDEYLSACKSI